ncbi:MAG: type II toxin-antitoxin system HicB family antitoxin [Peptococcaceae bacterium]|nr:type II toxin-antitoxin system HicB family antitoxin [Peptococcaceae bacterium]
MKRAYPIILTPGNSGYNVSIPDIDRSTQGRNIAEAIYMARDTLGMWAIGAEDEGRRIPEPSMYPVKYSDKDIITYVDIDFEEYRQKQDTTVERTNITLPRYLKRRAREAGINFSQELQERLKEKLSIQ